MPDSAELAFAEQFCTQKQMEVLRLRSQDVGLRPIARMLGITPASVKSRLDSADLRIQKAIREKGLT